MTRHSTHLGGWRVIGLIGLAALWLLQGCTHDLLQITDPDIIPDVNTPSGALALKNGVILRLEQVTAGLGGNGPDNLFIYGGLLADEWRSGDTFVQRNDMDQRLFDPTNTFLAGPFRSLNRVRVQSQTAIATLRTYSPSPASNIGLMFGLTAFVENLAGEYYCNGIPLSAANPDGTITYGDPISDDSAFALAAATADSALANQSGPDSARVRQLASIVKARTLLNRGQFAAAATAVAGVATTFHYDATYSANAGQNELWNLNTSIKRYTMGDNEGGNGLPFASALDPRIPRRVGGPVFDSATPLTAILQGIWLRFSSVTIAGGIEARLIEAEAALKAGDNATWLARLNALRANTALYPAAPADTSYKPRPGVVLAALADPGTQAARENLMFSERAFWLFSTGHRLGDLRRLVRQYGRPVESVYPTGLYVKGGLYGSAVSLPIPQDEQNNPKFVQCSDRNP